MKVRQRMGWKELEGMNVGSANTIEGDMGRPRIDSNQMPTIRSLHNSIGNNICTNHAKGLTRMNVDRSSEERPMRIQQDQWGTMSPGQRIRICTHIHDPLLLLSICAYLYTYISTRLHAELRPFAERSTFPFLYQWRHNYVQPCGTLLIIYSLRLTIKDGLLLSGTLLWSPL
jgi:hypothetical protein